MQGNDGTGLYENYRGVPVIGAYRWIEDRELALLAEIEQEEAFAPGERTGLGDRTGGPGGEEEIALKEKVHRSWSVNEDVPKGLLLGEHPPNHKD